VVGDGVFDDDLDGGTVVVLVAGAECLVSFGEVCCMSFGEDFLLGDLLLEALFVDSVRADLARIFLRACMLSICSVESIGILGRVTYELRGEADSHSRGPWC
jgi:hypothetical protein